MIVYKNILERLKTSGYNTYILMKNSILSQGTISSIRHNRPISMNTIDTLCKLLNCQPGDILEYIEDEKE